MKAARDIQKRFEGNYNIESVNIDGGDKSELEVIISGEKLDALGVSTTKIADIIKSYNQSFPLGSFTINTKKYDLRIEGDIESFQSLLKVPVSLSDWGSVPLGEFATIQRKWSNVAIERMNMGEYVDIPFVRLNFNKEPRKSVFETSTSVRAAMAEYIQTLWPEWKIEYGLDLAAVITQDYKDLANNALQTIILVYICIFFFVGLKESLIASLSTGIFDIDHDSQCDGFVTQLHDQFLAYSVLWYSHRSDARHHRRDDEEIQDGIQSCHCCTPHSKRTQTLGHIEYCCHADSFCPYDVAPWYCW
jgi:multidrug efflux pump subunit AcrB